MQSLLLSASLQGLQCKNLYEVGGGTRQEPGGVVGRRFLGALRKRHFKLGRLGLREKKRVTALVQVLS